MHTNSLFRLFRGNSPRKLRSALWPAFLGWMVIAMSGVAQPHPIPHVRLEGVPTDVMIGGYFGFRIYFSNIGTQEGYVPYIDLEVDSAGADGSPYDLSACIHDCDGLTVVPPTSPSGDARDTTYNVPPFSGGFYNFTATPCAQNSGWESHPLARPSLVGTDIYPCPGHSWSVIKLVNGVVYPGEPELYVDVLVKVSELADPYIIANSLTALRIQARGGFAYGTSALPNQTDTVVDPAEDHPPCGYPVTDPTKHWAAMAEVHPTLFTISKTFFGREDETATGPNNLFFYGLVVDVATGQKISNLTIKDLLPKNLMFHHVEKVVPMPGAVGPPIFYLGGTLAGFTPNLLLGGACPNDDYGISHTPVFASGQNFLELTLCHDVMGVPGPELAVVIACYVPEFDLDGNVILDPANCTPKNSQNEVFVVGDWLPADCRDQIPPNSQTTIPVASPHAFHVLADKCVGIQKSRSPPPPVSFVPGDTLTYVLDFQVSDYRTLDTVEVIDFLSDGQELFGPAPTLLVTDQSGTTMGTFTIGTDLDVTPNQPPICRDYVGNNPGKEFNNSTRLTFHVSALMTSVHATPRHSHGIITGGSAGTLSPQRAFGQITFQVKVSDRFNLPQGLRPGDIWVDKSDFLDNCVTLRGSVLDNQPLVNIPSVHNGCVAEDQSQIQIPIAGTALTKSVYAIKPFGASIPIFYPPPTMPVGPGDEVTFCLSMMLPSSDGENLVIRDWQSTPIFKLDDPKAIGNSSSPWPATSSGLPSSASLLPSTAGAGVLDTFNPWFQNNFSPVTINAYYPPVHLAQNMLEFVYGSFNDPGNIPRLNQIFYTLTVGSAPIGDAYNIVNVAQECEDNTFSTGSSICTKATATLILGAPRLKLTKGIVAASDPHADFTSTDLGSLVFSAFGNDCVTPKRFSGGVLSSTSIPAGLNADIKSLAPGSQVTFVLVVENLGHGPRGAFGVTILDTLPLCFKNPGPACVYDGAHAFIPSSGNLFSGGLVLTDPGLSMGALGPYHPSSGLNIAVIIFDATYAPAPGDTGCCVNHAELTHYSNVPGPGGDNFITSPLDSHLVAQAADDAYAGPPPVLICAPDMTVICGVPWSFTPPTAPATCCGSSVITELSTVTTGTCKSTRTWQVDQCGHTTTCSQTVTILNDYTPPVITTCPADRTLPPVGLPSCTAAIPDMTGDVVAHDACSAITVQQIPPSGTWGPGVYPVIFVICDACSNCVTCTNYVTVPAVLTFNCPDQLIVNCTDNNGAVVNYTPSASSVCCSPVNVLCSHPSTQYPIGITPVTCTAHDNCGNSSVCSYSVVVIGHASAIGVPHGEWAKQDGGANAQRANAITVDGTGHSYVAGTFSGTATFTPLIGPVTTLTSAGYEDAFLAKYDTTGGFLWVIQIGGPYFDEGLGAAVDAQGNCFVTGSFQGPATFGNATHTPSQTLTPAPSGISQMFLAKYDPLGNLLWVRSTVGPGDFVAVGEAVAVDPLGNAYVTGAYNNAAQFGPPATSLVGQGDQDCFLAKYSSGGNVLWVESSTGTVPDYIAHGRGVAVDALGVAWITGNFSDSTTFGNTVLSGYGAGQRTAFVAKYDHDGVEGSPGWAWAAQTLCVNSFACGDHYGQAIGVDGNGNSYFAAFYNGTATIDPASLLNPVTAPPGFNDVMVGSFGSDGSPRWLRNGPALALGSGNDDREPRGMAVDHAGNVYVTGFLGTQDFYPDAGRDVWLVHLNASGSLMWREEGRGDNGQLNAGRGVALDPAGCIYLTGSFTDPSLSFDAFNPLHIPLAAPSGAEEVLLTKYCPSCECIPVSIVTQPSDQWTSTGLPVTFTVTASGTPPLTFGWYRNGVLITGNSPCWTINTVTTASGLTSTLTLTCFPAGWSYADTFSAGVANLWCFDTVVQSTGAQIIRFKIVGGWESYTNRFRLDITAPAGVAYDIQYRNDLNLSTPWQVLTNGVGTGSNAPVVDPSPPPSMRYYRLRLRD